MERTGPSRRNRIWDLDTRLWTGGAALHLPLDGAARCWAFRNPGSPALLVFPDQKQAGIFCSDWETLFPEEPVRLLQEIPLTPGGMTDRALPVQRGETLAGWKREGGLLAASGGSLLAPVFRGSRDIRILPGRDYSRKNLLDWLVHAGYVRSDIVWAPGQFVFRGYILDIFDPAYAHPLRFEFFDDTVESIRSFSPRTQMSVGVLEDTDIHSLSASKQASLFDFLPEGTVSAFFEPSRIEVSAESLSRTPGRTSRKRRKKRGPPLVAGRLSQACVTPADQDHSLRIVLGKPPDALEEIPPFGGNLEKFRWTCSAWEKDGCRVCLVIRNRRILLFRGRSPPHRGGSALPGISRSRGTGRLHIRPRACGHI